MSRRHKAELRAISPDTKFNSELLARFINNIMEHGKKAIAEKIVYGAFERIEQKHKVNPLETFNTAMAKVRPSLEVTSVRIGGSNYQVPSQVTERRGYTLAVRWIITAASKRSEKTMTDKLAGELFDAANLRGMAIKKKEDVFKMAESNRAFTHLSPRRVAG